MKKFSIVAALAIAISGIFASCGNSPAKANLKNDVDTLSYAIGMAQTQGLKQYLLQMDIDTTYIDEFVKGLNDGANAGDNKKKAAYYMGVQIGQQISNRMRRLYKDYLSEELHGRLRSGRTRQGHHDNGAGWPGSSAEDDGYQV